MAQPTHSHHETISQLTKAFAFPIAAYDGLVDQFIKELDEGLRVEDAMVTTTVLPLLSSPQSLRSYRFNVTNALFMSDI